jgi:predicted alpha/beta superfamily hydrolase
MCACYSELYHRALDDLIMEKSMSVNHLLIATLFVFGLMNVLPAFAQVENKPLVIVESLDINSENLREKRHINVYLPDEYKLNRTKSFPVVYLLNSQTADDFSYVANWVKNAIKLRMISPIILVAIEDTKLLDFVGTSESEIDKANFRNLGRAELFRRFLNEELITEISLRYPRTEERVLVGDSWAGLFTLEVLLRTPENFQTYIVISPQLIWNDEYLTSKFPELWRPQNSKIKNLYLFDHGKLVMNSYLGRFLQMLADQKPKLLYWECTSFNEVHPLYQPMLLFALQKLFVIAPEKK